ncbi:MAG: hypothetical protein R3E47_10240 [Paracoccaceae bacterium]
MSLTQVRARRKLTGFGRYFRCLDAGFSGRSDAELRMAGGNPDLAEKTLLIRLTMLLSFGKSRGIGLLYD